VPTVVGVPAAASAPYDVGLVRKKRSRKPKPRRDDGVPMKRGGGSEDEPIVRAYGSPNCEQASCDREGSHPGTHFNRARDTWFGQTADGTWRVFPRDGVPVDLRAS